MTQGNRLRILFDVNHPAQVHLFRNAIADLERRGHEITVTSREKEVTTQLLDAYGIDHTPLSTQRTGIPGLALEQLIRVTRLLGIVRGFKPDVLVSRPNPAVAHAGALGRAKTIAVTDTHVKTRAMRVLTNSLTFPFVDVVCAPPSLDLPVPDEKRRAMSMQELAYLHPRYFEPDPQALVEAGLDPNVPFSVVRLVGWDAFHDVGFQGISPAAMETLVSRLETHGAVYITSERALPPFLAEYALPTPPELIHQVLYHADLYVGDSGTMATEAALLGTPAIRTNSMVGDGEESVFLELEQRYGLMRSFTDERHAIDAVEDLLSGDVDTTDWHARRERIVADYPDPNEVLVDAILEGEYRDTSPTAVSADTR